MKSKGMIVKLKGQNCIILTRDGTYHKIPVSRVTNPRVGAESEFSPINWVSQLRPFLMVASILIFVLGFGMYRLSFPPAAAAYVSLDINPSIELAVDANARVTDTRAINDDAAKLLDGMNLDGKDLYSSIREIVDKAAKAGYIKPNRTNYILSTVAPVENKSAAVVDYDTIEKNLKASVDNKDLDVQFVILSTDLATRNEAKSNGISAGKMMVYKNSLHSGDNVTLQQVKQDSLTNLVNTYKVHILPNNKKAIVKLLHVPSKSRRFKKQLTFGDTVMSSPQETDEASNEEISNHSKKDLDGDDTEKDDQKVEKTGKLPKTPVNRQDKKLPGAKRIKLKEALETNTQTTDETDSDSTAISETASEKQKELKEKQLKEKQQTEEDRNKKQIKEKILGDSPSKTGEDDD